MQNFRISCQNGIKNAGSCVYMIVERYATRTYENNRY